MGTIIIITGEDVKNTRERQIERERKRHDPIDLKQFTQIEKFLDRKPIKLKEEKSRKHKDEIKNNKINEGSLYIT